MSGRCRKYDFTFSKIAARLSGAYTFADTGSSTFFPLSTRKNSAYQIVLISESVQ
jgi:hypothetical protein